MADANPLAKLRDIHLPKPISIWPLAPGWYLLLTLILLILVAVAIVIYRHQRKTRGKKLALQQLASLRDLAKRAQTSHAIAQLSILLRRLALSVSSRQEVASLHDDAWLQFLDETGETDGFTSGPGKVLITAPYQRQTPEVTEELFLLAQRWIELNV